MGFANANAAGLNLDFYLMNSFSTMTGLAAAVMSTCLCDHVFSIKEGGVQLP